MMLRRLRWVIVIGAVLAGCAYKAASSTDTAREATVDRNRVGCVDVGLDRRGDLGTNAVVRFTFDNECAQPATLDLAWANVIGRTAEGAELALVPTVSAGEGGIRLDAHASGETTIVYPAPTPVGQLCVDVASFAHEHPARWRCLGSREAVAVR